MPESKQSPESRLTEPNDVKESQQLEELKALRPWYRAEIGPRLRPSVRDFYKNYAKLEGDELLTHLYSIRDQAWPLGEYPCVGQWQWLWSTIPKFHSYPLVLDCIINGGSALDLGCCVGQDLRQLAADGAPTTNMYASDLYGELWELGYDLYRDRETMKAHFIQADILDEKSRLSELTGNIDVFIVCQFLHLFSWEDQITICKKMVAMSRAGSMIIGYQVGITEFQSHKTPWGTMCFQNAKSFKEMWERVSEETKTSWEVDVEEVHLSQWGLEPEDLAWMGPNALGVNFTITRGGEGNLSTS